MRNRTSLGLALALLLGAVNGWATPIPRFETLVAHRSLPKSPLLPKPVSAPPFASTKITRIDTTLHLAPDTGVVDGHVEVELSSLGTTSQIALLLDSGLSVSTATASGKSVTVQNTPTQGYDYATLGITPTVGSGESLVISADYSGTLACKNQGCKMGAPLGFLLENAAIPSVIDQDGIGGYNAWGASRTLTISVPTGTDVVASGDLSGTSQANGESTTVWKIPGYPSYGGNVVMFGQLSTVTVSGASPKSDVYAVSSSPKYATDMAGWMTDILPFLDDQAGQALPYQELKVFKLPLGWLDIFRGTAGYGLTLLSEDYAGPSDAYFEETLAHENAHQWWGVLVSPSDIRNTRWLVEGLATLSQIDYSAEHLNTVGSREEYLARRYREHWLTVHYLGDPSLPLVVQNPSSIPQDSIQNTLWAYIRSSAMLEHLRVLVGDDVFKTTLRSWAKTCSQQFCDTADFLNVIQTTSGQDLSKVFSQYVWDGTAVEPRFSFTQAEGEKPVVTAEGIDGQTLSLRLQVTLRTGEVKEMLVTFEGSTPVELDVTEPVLRVRPNPLHDGFVWSRSAQPGDQDFDGEVDGFDVIHCARQLGKVAQPSQPGGEGVWALDLDFDPRSDANDDGTIDESDLSAVTDLFGTVKGAG